MTKTEKTSPAPKNDLSALYRPLGLKAVLAAHTALKSRPAAKKIA